MRAISIVIPCRNETAATVETAIEKLRSELTSYRLDIVVIENGSSLLSRIPRARCYHIKQAGLGLALRLGIRNAKLENVFFPPADMSYDLSFVASALSEKADIVIGSKAARGSVVARPIKRRIASRIYGIKTRLIDGVHVKDVTGVKLYRRSKVLPLLGLCRSNGIGFEVELERQAETHGLDVIEIPVVVSDFRGGGLWRWIER